MIESLVLTVENSREEIELGLHPLVPGEDLLLGFDKVDAGDFLKEAV